MSAKKAAASEQPFRYAAAIAELERILEALEGDAVDVDLLAAQVKRASELIRLCRERLQSTQLEIEQVVAELESDPAAGEPDAAS